MRLLSNTLGEHVVQRPSSILSLVLLLPSMWAYVEGELSDIPSFSPPLHSRAAYLLRAFPLRRIQGCGFAPRPRRSRPSMPLSKLVRHCVRAMLLIQLGSVDMLLPEISALYFSPTCRECVSVGQTNHLTLVWKHSNRTLVAESELR